MKMGLMVMPAMMAAMIVIEAIRVMVMITETTCDFVCLCACVRVCQRNVRAHV